MHVSHTHHAPQPYFQISVLLLVLQPGTFRTLYAGDVGTMDRTHELRIYWVSSRALLTVINRVTSQAMTPLKHGAAHTCATLPAHTTVCNCQHTPATLVPAGHTVQITPAQGQISDRSEPNMSCAAFILQATHHNGQVYLTSSEYWGTGTVRMPSIYWAVVKPAPGLCSVTRLDWGVVASAEGLAAAYPVIAARTDGRAAVAFAYSGAGTISGGKYPANPGVLGNACWWGRCWSNFVMQYPKRRRAVQMRVCMITSAC